MQLETDVIFVDPNSLLRPHLGFTSFTLNQRLNFWIMIPKRKDEKGIPYPLLTGKQTTFL